MKKPHINIIHRIGIFVLTLTLLAIGVDNYNLQIKKEVSELAEIHKKIGVVKIEPLTKSKNSEFGELIKASVISSKLDQEEFKEIIVDYNKEDDENIYILKIDSSLSEEKLAKIYKESAKIVNNSEPNYVVELASDTSVKAINLDQLKKSKPDSFLTPKVKVAVIDSGIDETHVKLKGNYVDYVNFATDSKTNEDLFGHGTHIAGVILAEAPNSVIIPIKFTDGKLGRLSDLLKGIDYAIEKDANIINLSLGIIENSKFLAEKINKALKNNIIVVAAAGNQNSDQKFYPAAQEGVISVAALNKKGEKLFSSNYGDWVDFAVIGQDVYSSFPKNTYKYWSGTSQSAAKLTGVIIKKSKNNDLHEAVKLLAKSEPTKNIGKIIFTEDYFFQQNLISNF